MARKDYEKLLRETFNGEKRIDGYWELPAARTATFVLRLPIESFLWHFDLGWIKNLFGDDKHWIMTTSIVDRPAGKVYHLPPQKDVCYKFTFYNVDFDDSAPR